MSLYSDYDLEKWARGGGVRPFDPDLLNPASIDLRLGSTIRTAKWWWSIPAMRPIAHKRKWEKWGDPQPMGHFTLWPGQFVLCDTLETLTIPNNAGGFLFLKSTPGRWGYEHSHSGDFDPGFHGTGTLEAYNFAPWPLELRPEMRFCQLVLIKLTRKPRYLYGKRGHYQGQSGPTPGWRAP